jgi:hypothetical protein
LDVDALGPALLDLLKREDTSMLKYTKATLVALVMVLAIPLIAASQTANQVTFYENINYGGAYLTFTGIRDEPDLRAYNTGGLGSPNWNDRISSFKVGSNVNLVVYRDINFKGTKWTITGPASISTLVSNGWNDKISSFRIVPK